MCEKSNNFLHFSRYHILYTYSVIKILKTRVIIFIIALFYSTDKSDLSFTRVKQSLLSSFMDEQHYALVYAIEYITSLQSRFSMWFTLSQSRLCESLIDQEQSIPIHKHRCLYLVPHVDQTCDACTVCRADRSPIMNGKVKYYTFLVLCG